MVYNDRQTELTPEVIKELNISDDVLQEVHDSVRSIEMLRRLVSPDRKYARDLERDEQGRIKVNVTDLHILEDMDYFRPLAITFQETGRFTDIVPSRHPNSPYAKFWKEQKRRCIKGYVRESDGEWVSGYHYHYLNLSRIMLTEFVGDGKRADRVNQFPTFWDSDYIFFHYCEQAEEQGLHANLLKARGKGFSFKMGAMDARNMIWIKESLSFTFASEKEYLDPDKDGIMGKTWKMLDFIGDNTPLPRARLKDTPFEKTLGYINPATGAREGMLSTATGTTLKDRPDRARGKRGKLIKFEESGVFPYLLIAWKIAQKSVEQNEAVFGMLLAGGTGGTEGADFEAAEELFYHGEAHNVYMLPNVFDKDTDPEVQTSSLFIGDYFNRERTFDKDGNSDIILGLVKIFQVREKIRRTNSDPMVLVREKAESPITPQEAVLRTGDSIFPVNSLKDYLEQISPNMEDFISKHFIGRYIPAEEKGKYKWFTDFTMKPVREYPIRDDLKKEGAVEIFEQPYINPETGKAPAGRYIAGIDPYDDDHSTTNSLGSCFIFDLWTDRIVAEYTARPKFAADFYDTCIKLQLHYNAIANYENDKKGLFAHYSNHNKLHLLVDTPAILKDMEIVKTQGYGNKAKGTPSNKFVNAWARRLQADWMKKPAIQGQQFDEEEDDSLIINIHKIRSLGYIKEAIKWDIDGNFDRVSAMGMVMILREDRMKFIDKGNTTKEDADPFKSDFWQKQFKVKKNIFEKDRLEMMKRRMQAKTGAFQN